MMSHQSKKKPLLQLTSLALFSVVLVACSGGVGGGSRTATPVTTTSTTPGSSSTSNSGQFSLLTYNIAGLLQGISSSNPVINTAKISPLLNNFDICVIQEDFTYHDDLKRDAMHPFQSIPLSGQSSSVNDGLNRFSNSSFIDFERFKWSTCYGGFSFTQGRFAGSDCLASKGYSMARHEISPGVFLDIYNHHHADAASNPQDIAARQSNFTQMAQTILPLSQGKAVIVAGDTKLGASRVEDQQTLGDFLMVCNLKDVARTLSFPERIDRVMFRSSAKLELTPSSYRVAKEFVDSAGGPLSDHEGIEVPLIGSKNPKLRS
jgi:hypothetical protein